MIDQNWYKSGAIDDYKYGYDADSNVLWKENMRSSTNSELYGDQSGHFYDGLSRLQHFQRGTLSAGHDSISGSAGHSQDWSLDQTGNATSITTDGGTPQSRGINKQNEITSITGATTPGYDSDGNTTLDETNHALTYDAWNRLATFGGTSETFTYDALGRRITSVVGSTTRHLYYSKQWQVLEERLNTATAANIQNIWGLGYMDAMVVRDRDADSNGATGNLGKSGSGLEERRYSQYDANYNVTSITDTSGNVKERYQYDPYGVVKILNGASDADSGVSDWSADANNTSDWGWVHFHQGGRYDGTTKLYSFRNRDYSPTLQRWMQEDPMVYVDGMNLYQYVRSTPVLSLDPSGLKAVTPKPDDPAFTRPYDKLFVVPHLKWVSFKSNIGSVYNLPWQDGHTNYSKSNRVLGYARYRIGVQVDISEEGDCLWYLKGKVDFEFIKIVLNLFAIEHEKAKVSEQYGHEQRHVVNGFRIATYVAKALDDAIDAVNPFDNKEEAYATKVELQDEFRKMARDLQNLEGADEGEGGHQFDEPKGGTGYPPIGPVPDPESPK